MNAKRAGIYARRGFLYVRTKLLTEDGLWLEDGPCRKLAEDSRADEIGDAVLEALARSGTIIPHPTEWKNVDEDNPILQASSIKRWSTFRKGARTLGIGLEAGELTLSPTRNEREDGFVYLDSELRLPATASSAEIGETVNEALSLCK